MKQNIIQQKKILSNNHLDYFSQLEMYLKNIHLKEFKTKKLIKYSLFNKYCYKFHNINSLINNEILYHSFKILLKNCSIDNTFQNKKIFYVISDFIKIKKIRNNYKLFFEIDKYFNVIIEMDFKSINEIEKFIIDVIFIDNCYQNYNINFSYNNSLNNDYKLYSIEKLY